MYRKHFGFSRSAFSKDIDINDLFDSMSTKEMHTRLNYLIDLRGIGLFTGEPGAGKTTACRRAVSLLHAGRHRVFYVSLSTGNVMDTYKTIAWEMGLPTERSRSSLFKAIQAEVSRLCSEHRLMPVLIVDEAHHLRSDVLEDLRLLTNYRMDSENRLCLLLVGHAELRRRIGMAVHESLAQRIVVRFHMQGLARDELPPFLGHLLRLAGTETQLFDPAAMEAIFQATHGLPRRICVLAQHTLNAAALARAVVATEEHVRLAVNEVM